MLVHPLHAAGAKGGPKRVRRKPSEVVDCDFDNYDRCDPFFAISTLRKILVSVQSTHLTMKVDHHKLCLQLLGLIEPFITLSPAR